MILFHRLTRAQMDTIVVIQLSALQGLLDNRKIVINLDDKARTWLADAGYDPVYGARPLKRAIQRQLQNPLAEMLLEGSVNDGDTIAVSADSAGLVINGRAVAQAAE